jgi:hypothetical protein
MSSSKWRRRNHCAAIAPVEEWTGCAAIADAHVFRAQVYRGGVLLAVKNSMEIRQRIVAVLTECAIVPVRAAHIAASHCSRRKSRQSMRQMEQGLADPDGWPGRLVQALTCRQRTGLRARPYTHAV